MKIIQSSKVRMHLNFLMKVPESAVDKHTSAGKKLGRDVLHFFTEGAQVANERFEDPYRDECLQAYLHEEKLFGRKHRSEHVRKRKRESFSKKSKKNKQEESESEDNSDSSSDEEMEDSSKKRKSKKSSSKKAAKKSKTSKEKEEDMEIETEGKGKEEEDKSDEIVDSKEATEYLKEKDVMKDIIQAQIIRGKKPATYYAELCLPGTWGNKKYL